MGELATTGILVLAGVIAISYMIWSTKSANRKFEAQMTKRQNDALDGIIKQHQSPPIMELPRGAKLLWIISGCHGTSLVARLMRPEEIPQEYTLSRWISPEEAAGSDLSRVHETTGSFPRLAIIKEQEGGDIATDKQTPIMRLSPGQKLVWMRTGCNTETLTRPRTSKETAEAYYVFNWTGEGSGVALTTLVLET